MSGEVVNGTPELVELIVQRVLARLPQQASAKLPVAERTSDVEAKFSGRLLTASMLHNLKLGSRLSVSPRCVVTPEAKDQLRQKGVQLHWQQAVEEKASRGTSQVPQQHSSENKTVAWYWSPLKPTAGVRQIPGQASFDALGIELQRRNCATALAMELKQSLANGNRWHIVACERPLKLQQVLNRQSLFAPIVSLNQQSSLEQLSDVETRLVLVPTPIVTWSLRRLLKCWGQFQNQQVQSPQTHNRGAK